MSETPGIYLVNQDPDPMPDPKWVIKRYCFRCQSVERFLRCDNCGPYFCLGHCEWEGGEYDGLRHGPDVPIHKLCCG